MTNPISLAGSAVVDGIAGTEPHGRVLSLDLPWVGRQWLPVEGDVVDRFLCNFRAPAERLERLIPRPFTLDSYDEYGFVSVCALEVKNMGIAGTPSWMRFHNLEMLYRVGVRLGSKPTFLTLRSDTGSAALALLGGLFSHYRLKRASIELARAPGCWTMRCASRDGLADARLAVETDALADTQRGSVFASANEADKFLLGMGFSADSDARGRVIVQPIDHSPWNARFVGVREAKFAFLDRFAERYGVPLVYDSTLAMRGIRQTWLAARRGR